MKKLLQVLLLVLFSLSIYGQEKFKIVQEGDEEMHPRFVKFNKDAVRFISPDNYLKTILKTKSFEGFILLDQETDHLGYTHYRLQQTINNIPVAYSTYSIHVKNNLITTANGDWFKNIPSGVPQKRASLNSEGAMVKAKQIVRAKKYAWEVATLNDRGKKVFMGEEINNKGKLVYITKNNSLKSSELRLAYKFDMFSAAPLDRKLVYIDAINGETLFIEQKMHSADVEGTANTGHHGTRTITVSNSGNGYVTQQNGNRRISLRNMNGASLPTQQGQTMNGTLYSSNSTSFNFSGNQAYYMAAYWGAEQTWDMYKNTFNRNSYDGNGSNIGLFVNGGGQGANNNAFWIGTQGYFGNGTNGGAPLTPLDVVSHEITHGVIGTSARLVYQGESGALNESFADIFGSYAEYYAFNSVDNNVWTLGDKISIKRSLSNPKTYNQPDTYQGSLWASTNSSADNGGVHTNSGVMNYWFYLTSQGGNGTNDNNTSYSVDGIGIDKAGQIAYRALVYYLSNNSNYNAARNAVINAAKDLYGQNSCEVKTVTDAMNAVGIGAKYSGSACETSNTCGAVTGVNSSNVTTSSATINWNAVSGVSDYILEYKTSTAANYTSVNVSGTSYSLSVTADVSYDVRLKYTCTTGEESPYSTVISFTATDGGGSGNCNPVNGVSSTNISTSSATINWNSISGVSNYTLEYKTTSASNYSSVSASGNSKGLTGLSPNTTYNVRLKYNCPTEGQGNDPCTGVAEYQPGTFYPFGSKVTFQGSLYEATPSGWINLGPCGATTGGGTSQESPYSSVISFTTTGVTGPCSGVPIYQPGIPYQPGSKVIYLGGLYQMNIFYQWVYLGPCFSGFSSSVASTTGSVINSGLISIYPNPASDYITLSTNGATKEQISVIIYDINGRTMLNKQLSAGKGIHSSTLDISKLESGIYIINIGGEISKKLIKN